MRETTWAGGAKLNYADVKRIQKRKRLTRDDAAKMAERLGVCRETVWRVHTGKSWSKVRFQRLPNEFKRCVVCRARFGRRFPNGRHRSDKLWDQKLTCGNPCHVKLNWMRGYYDGR